MECPGCRQAIELSLEFPDGAGDPAAPQLTAALAASLPVLPETRGTDGLTDKERQDDAEAFAQGAGKPPGPESFAAARAALGWRHRLGQCWCGAQHSDLTDSGDVHTTIGPLPAETKEKT